MTNAMKAKWVAMLLCLAPVAGWAQGMMDGGGDGMMGGRMMSGASPRHVYFMRHGLPPPYADMSNPLPAGAENIAAGKQLYDGNCAVCHGAQGRGDGEGAMTLSPRPSDLASIVRMPMARDGYLYWSIAEGGAQFNTAMPAMKGVLPPADIWKIILYVRTF